MKIYQNLDNQLSEKLRKRVETFVYANDSQPQLTSGKGVRRVKQNNYHDPEKNEVSSDAEVFNNNIIPIVRNS